MFGENPGELAEERLSPGELKRSFATRPVWQRFIIVAGGPVFNLIFATFLFFIIVLVAGMPQPVDTTTIGGVGQDTPAAAAGLQEGDTILAINGVETKRWEEVSQLIKNSEGRQIVTRDLRITTDYPENTEKIWENMFKLCGLCELCGVSYIRTKLLNQRRIPCPLKPKL